MYPGMFGGYKKPEPEENKRCETCKFYLQQKANDCYGKCTNEESVSFNPQFNFVCKLWEKK